MLSKPALHLALCCLALFFSSCFSNPPATSGATDEPEIHDRDDEGDKNKETLQFCLESMADLIESINHYQNERSSIIHDYNRFLTGMESSRQSMFDSHHISPVTLRSTRSEYSSRRRKEPRLKQPPRRPHPLREKKSKLNP